MRKSLLLLVFSFVSTLGFQIIAAAQPASKGIQAPSITKRFTRAKLQSEIEKACRNGPWRKANYGRAAAQSIIKMGWQFIEIGNGHLALEAFLTALNTGPEPPDAYWGLGIASHVTDFPIETIDSCFAQAKRKLPKVAALYGDHGRVLESRNLDERAKGEFNKALNIDANLITAHIGLFHIYSKQNNTAKATLHKNRLIQLKKSSSK